MPWGPRGRVSEWVLWGPQGDPETAVSPVNPEVGLLQRARVGSPHIALVLDTPSVGAGYTSAPSVGA